VEKAHRLVLKHIKSGKVLARKLEEDLKQYGLNRSEYTFLGYLDTYGRQPIQVMTSFLDLTSGTMTYLVNKLIKKEYVERIQSLEDKRIYYVHLTDLGKSFFDEMSVKHLGYVDKVISRVLNEDEKNTLGQLLTKLGKGLDSD
jgi:MarR family 2-MHQ and catechol resistance regulon transcriptional repressor